MPIDGPPKTFIHNDNAYIFDKFGLTKNGEPLCVENYCILLANQMSTHVVLFKDERIQSRWKIDILESDIDWEANFHELKLKNHKGLDRMCTWYYDSYPLLIE